MNPLDKAVRAIAAENLGLAQGETLLVVADPPQAGLAQRIVESARGQALACELLLVGTVERAGREPQGFTRQALASCPAALLVTSRSLSHTTVRRQACHLDRVRIASMPGLTGDMLIRLFQPGLARQLCRRTESLAGKLGSAGRVRVRTSTGTDISFSVAGRKLFLDTGLYLEPGRFGNLPAGEVSWAPVEDSATGRLVVDVAFAGLGVVSGLELEIDRGKIISARGRGSRRLLGLLREPQERTVGEFGVGTNPLAAPCPVTLEAEKAVGTVHFGFGDNRSFAGSNSAAGHWDAVLRCTALELDGRTVSLTEN